MLHELQSDSMQCARRGMREHENGADADGRYPFLREWPALLKPFGLACETLEVYVSDNFSIRRTEGGYEVSSIEGAVLGTTASFQEARDLLPVHQWYS